MIERTRAGLAAAAANNRHGGRPRKVDAAAVARAKELKGKGISASDIGKMLGVFRATVGPFHTQFFQIAAREVVCGDELAECSSCRGSRLTK
jgi:transposase